MTFMVGFCNWQRMKHRNIPSNNGGFHSFQFYQFFSRRQSASRLSWSTRDQRSFTSTQTLLISQGMESTGRSSIKVSWMMSDNIAAGLLKLVSSKDSLQELFGTKCQNVQK